MQYYFYEKGFEIFRTIKEEDEIWNNAYLNGIHEFVLWGCLIDLVKHLTSLGMTWMDMIKMDMIKMDTTKMDMIKMDTTKMDMIKRDTTKMDMIKMGVT